MEAVLAEGVAALGAEEVVRMPRLVQRRHAFIQDRAVAVGTAGREEVVVVDLAVGLPVAFEEVPRAQLLVAVGASEVLRMPRLPQRSDHLSYDGLVTSAAASLLGRGDSLFGHVCGQRTQHTIQLVHWRGRGLLGRRGRRRGRSGRGRRGRGTLGLLRFGVSRVYLCLEAAGIDLEVAEGSHQVVQLLGGAGGGGVGRPGRRRRGLLGLLRLRGSLQGRGHGLGRRGRSDGHLGRLDLVGHRVRLDDLSASVDAVQLVEQGIHRWPGTVDRAIGRSSWLFEDTCVPGVVEVLEESVQFGQVVVEGHLGSSSRRPLFRPYFFHPLLVVHLIMPIAVVDVVVNESSVWGGAWGGAWGGRGRPVVGWVRGTRGGAPRGYGIL